jgi:integrase
VAPNPSDRIFPQLSPGGPDKKLGFYFTKWWSRYRREIGVYEAGLDYHSFRHTVATALGAAGVHPDHRRALLGHEGKYTDERVYVKDFPLTVLLDAIRRLDWPSVVSALNGVKLA